MYNLRFLAVCFIVISQFISPTSHADDSHFGLHGMTLFGGDDGLFASHLPMYHQPHNVQMVMQFHFSDAATDKAVKQQLAQQSTQSEQLWTIVPKPFDLMRLHPDSDNPLTHLQIEVVEGHFERGGTSRFSSQKIIIDKVIIFTELSMQTAQEKTNIAQYLMIAASNQSQNQFLIKLLENRPEADHLLRVLNPDRPMTYQVNSALTEQLTTEKQAGPFTAPITLELSNSLHASKVEFAEHLSISPEQLIEIYLETGELQ
ncbi:hypothetical protein BCU84_07095 [Shewanella sp. 10N.286.51.B7]|uniref:hypothetical protein n=1 Tax=Shewanella sp. 10N.286.51.B7 TaxID=1880836 RepID=UPI000C84D091|nr:hypothetical protein [Shewanella sp. 10N.286.51.B7]PMG78643.1 hypothetical protein BCU84_07095 [Shewanella sp. 10N.286.51.B7]